MRDKKFKKEKIYEMKAVEVYELILAGKYITRFPRGFWQRPEALDNAKECVRYLIDDYLKLSDKEVTEKLSISFFKKYKLSGMLTCCFNNSPYEAILNAYGDKFKPWEFNCIKMNYWNDETTKEAIKWIIEERLELTEDKLKEELSQELFFKNGLTGLLNNKFNGSPIKAINHAYDNKYHPWEFKYVGLNYWTKEHLIEAIHWLVEERLKLSDKEFTEQLSAKTFRDNGLASILSYTNYSVYEAINLY